MLTAASCINAGTKVDKGIDNLTSCPSTDTLDGGLVLSSKTCTGPVETPSSAHIPAQAHITFPTRIHIVTHSKRTRSSAVAERPRDASCLSVVSFNIPTVQFFLLLVTAASDLLVHKILLNSVLLSPIISGGVRPNPRTNNICCRNCFLQY